MGRLGSGHGWNVSGRALIRADHRGFGSGDEPCRWHSVLMKFTNKVQVDARELIFEGGVAEVDVVPVNGGNDSTPVVMQSVVRVNRQLKTCTGSSRPIARVRRQIIV